MSSTRPMLECEKAHAMGFPLTGYSAFFGATFGMLTYLRAMNIKPKSNWFPNSTTKMIGIPIIAVGAVAGGAFGSFLFRDRALLRLKQQEDIDRAHGV